MGAMMQAYLAGDQIRRKGFDEIALGGAIFSIARDQGFVVEPGGGRRSQPSLKDFARKYNIKSYQTLWETVKGAKIPRDYWVEYFCDSIGYTTKEFKIFFVLLAHTSRMEKKEYRQAMNPVLNDYADKSGFKIKGKALEEYEKLLNHDK